MYNRHKIFKRIKNTIGYIIAITVIVIAIGISGLRLLLTSANLYQEEIESLASSLLEQPVTIGGMDAKISGLVPTLIFKEVSLYTENQENILLALPRIDVSLSIEDLIFQQKFTPTHLMIKGVNLDVTRTVEGKINVRGVNLEALTASADKKDNADKGFNQWLLKRSQVGIEDSNIKWRDEQNAGLEWRFRNINFLLKNSDSRHQVALSGKLPAVMGSEINLALDIEGNIFEGHEWDARVYLESDKLNLSTIKRYYQPQLLKLNSGLVSVKAWVDFEKSKVSRASANLNLYDLQYRFKKNKKVEIQEFNSVFDIRRDANDAWYVTADNLHYRAKDDLRLDEGFSLAFSLENDDAKQVYFKARKVDVGRLNSLVNDLHILNPEHESILSKLNPVGELEDINIKWSGNELIKFNAKLNRIGMNDWKKLPYLRNLSGEIAYEHSMGTLIINAAMPELGFPGLFRKNFKLEQLVAKVVFSNTPVGTFYSINKLNTVSQELKTQSSARLWIPKDKSSPYMVLQTYFYNGDLSKTSNYLPVSIMDKKLVKWLDRAIVGGKVENGTVIFSGEFKKFPFKNNQGKFVVDFDATDVVFDYQPGWPKIKNAKLFSRFTGTGMDLRFASGEVLNNQLKESSAVIPEFSNADVIIDIKANGNLSDMGSFLVNSPIIKDGKDVVAGMKLQGNVDTVFNMVIPLASSKRKNKTLTYTGESEIQDGNIFMVNDKFAIKDISGTIKFTEKNIRSQKLNGIINRELNDFSLSSLENNRGIELAFSGAVKPGEILNDLDVPGADKFSGRTRWKGELLFPGTNHNKNYPVLNIKSNLEGFESNFPEIIDKNKITKRTTNFSVGFISKRKTRYSLWIKNRGGFIFDIVSGKKRSFLDKGAISFSDSRPKLPKQNILFIEGIVKKYTPSKWRFLSQEKNNKRSSFIRHPVVLNLDALTLVTEEYKKETGKKRDPVISPLSLPEINGIIGRLTLGKDFLGRLDFRTSRYDKGLRIDEVLLSSKNMKMYGQGNWGFNRGKHITFLDLTLSSENVGEMLNDLGFAAIINGGKGQTISKLYWNDALPEFSLDKLNGNVQLSIKNAVVSDVDVGAGRLLGLFSLSALPKKIFGDFKDTSDKGFSFEEARGELELENGNVFMDDFSIESTIGQVEINGRMGMAQRDYDLSISVLPEVGGTVAGLTALLVNLPAGIGVWLMDKMTGSQFNKATKLEYTVNGSWDQPVIKQIKTDNQVNE